MNPAITIAIVEDEPILCQYLCTIIHSLGDPFKVIGTANNGQDGLTLIASHHPDIILTDIQMPILSGIDMIAQATHQHLGGIYILLSAYQEFEYAQRALKLGVYDYLLKPIDTQEVENKLRHLAQSILQQTKLAHTHFFESLLLSTQTDSAFPAPYCYYICIQMGSASARFSDVSNSDFSDISHFPSIEQNHRIQCYFFSGSYANEKIIFILTEKKLSSSVLQDICASIESQLNSSIPIQLFISEPMQTTDAFIIQKKTIDSLRMVVFPFGENGIYMVDNHAPLPYLEPISEALRAILHAYKTNASFSSLLTALQTTWTKEKPCELVLLRQIEYVLQALATQNQYNTDAISATDILASSYSIDDVCNLMSLLWTKTPDSKISSIALELQQYLQSHFAEEISYRTLCKTFGYHEKYLSILFKRAFGYSPNQYLTKIRIEYAKQLLRLQPTLLQKEVASQCGFHDPLYFSRVFKNLVGVSPSEFIKQPID